MFQKFIIVKPLKIFSMVILFLSFVKNAGADFSQCRDKNFQDKVQQVAQEEKVDPDELLSVVAHESRCNYYVIAWNLPRKPETAKSKFFSTLNEAKALAEELISTKSYRVDVGIGQINYEANIRRKGWSLEEVLNPETALNRVAKILKERTWDEYHSSNPTYANKWKKLALSALSQIHSGSKIASLEIKKSSRSNSKANLSLIQVSSLKKERAQSNLIVYNGLEQSPSSEKPSSINSKGSSRFVIYPLF